MLRIFVITFLFSSTFLLTNITNAQTLEKRIDSLINLSQHTVDTDSSSSWADEALAASEAINYTSGIVNSILVKITNLVNEAKCDEALKYIIQNENLIRESKLDDKISFMMVLKANCYSYLNFFEKSEECLKEGKKFAKKIVDKNIRNYELGRFFRISAAIKQLNPKTSNDLETILDYHQKSAKLFSSVEKDGLLNTGVIISENSIGETFLKMKQEDSAKLHFEKALQHAIKYNTKKFVDQSYAGIANVHYKKDNLDSALFYLESALSIAKKNRNKLHLGEIYRLLSTVHLKKGNRTKSLEYLEKYTKSADNLLTSNKNAVRVSADLLLLENEKKYNFARNQYIIAVAAVVFLLIITLFLVTRILRKHKRVVNSNFEQQQELHGRLKKLQVPEQAEKIDDSVLDNLLNLAFSNDPRFLGVFTELQPNFVNKLIEKAPQLTASELTLSAYLRLGLTTKEIARYTKSSVRAVESRKYRLRKKLDIPSFEDINIWMIN